MGTGGTGNGASRRWVPCALLLGLAALTLAVRPAGPPEQVLHRDGDLVVVGAKPGPATAPAASGRGFAVFREATLRSGYTMHLERSPGIELLRPLLVDAAATIDHDTGLHLMVAVGTVDEPIGTEGAIDVVVSSSSVCAGSWLGCTSPAVYDGKVQRARIWINPRLFERTAEVVDNTVRHELGHALGLAHYDAVHDGEIQVMHSSRFDATDFRSGDVAGLVHLLGVATRSAPSTSTTTSTTSTTSSPTTTAPPPTTVAPTTAPPAPPPTTGPPATPTQPPPPPAPPVETRSVPVVDGVDVTTSSAGAAELATLGLSPPPPPDAVRGASPGGHDAPVSVAVILLVVNAWFAAAVWWHRRA